MAVGSRDFYDVLGVSRDASADEIRTAYRRLARQNHPDVNKDPAAAERFSEISEAYEVLRDDEKRRAYDRYGERWKAAAAGGVPPGAEPEGFGGGFPGFGTSAAGEGDLGDIFGSLFGGGRRRRGAADGFSLRGGDHRATIDLTLEEAFRGGSRKFQLSDGRDYEVTIPPGVREGQRIRLAGEGGAGAGGGPSGDLLLDVHLLRHPRFRLRGRDVEVDLPVSPWEAALGATVPVALLDGGIAQVKVKGGTSSGTRLRLKGEGWPAGDGRREDLHAVVKVMVPTKLSRRERKLFHELAEASSFDPRGQT
jgi:curved DNA-binding protein